ncbi:unnamed protein product [Mytilus coruscus]|uniref:Uncharacterized protein n=1 Tax=Mytilus coruscus TaxID=42192 RepID=A0A6J8DG24_MYTCO|nr:unnamed protein product [Mytilus coruscus]
MATSIAVNKTKRLITPRVIYTPEKAEMHMSYRLNEKKAMVKKIEATKREHNVDIHLKRDTLVMSFTPEDDREGMLIPQTDNFCPDQQDNLETHPKNTIMTQYSSENEHHLNFDMGNDDTVSKRTIIVENGTHSNTCTGEVINIGNNEDTVPKAAIEVENDSHSNERTGEATTQNCTINP